MSYENKFRSVCEEDDASSILFTKTEATNQCPYLLEHEIGA